MATLRVNPYTRPDGFRDFLDQIFISSIRFNPGFEFPTTIEIPPVGPGEDPNPGYLNLLEVFADTSEEAGLLASEPFLLSLDGYKLITLRKRFQRLTDVDANTGILRVWFLVKAIGVGTFVGELKDKKSRPILSGNLVLTIETENELVTQTIVRFPIS